MEKTLLTRIRSKIRYEPETGKFYWLQRTNSFRRQFFPGDEVVGRYQQFGYLLIGVCRQCYRAHHLAWLLMTGELPPKTVDMDHINGIRDDNRWSNLRLVTRSQNNMNGHLYRNNTSGIRGVWFREGRNVWAARITVDRKIISLGHHKTQEEAIKAREFAEEKYFGEFNKEKTRGSTHTKYNRN